MRYLAVGFWSGGSESFSLSRETDSNDAQEVLDFLCTEAKMNRENIDTILLLQSAINSTKAPEVVECWGAANGDFDADDAWGEPEETEEDKDA